MIHIEDHWEMVDSLQDISRIIREYYNSELADEMDRLMNEYDWSELESIEWIETNTLRALPYMGNDAPIVMYPLDYM